MPETQEAKEQKKKWYVTPDEVIWMQEMFENGSSKAEIARHFGFSRHTVYRRINSVDRITKPTKSTKPEKKKRVKLTKNQITLMKNLLKRGITRTQVAEHFGLSKNTTYKHVPATTK